MGLIPIVTKIGSPNFRRFLWNLFPVKSMRLLAHQINTMFSMAVKLHHNKQAALRAGDEALRQQIGEGKDLISVLRALL